MSQFQKDNLFEEALQMLYTYTKAKPMYEKLTLKGRKIPLLIRVVQLEKTKELVNRMQREV